MSDSEQQVPPREHREAIKLAFLWGHLPNAARLEVLATATRILKCMCLLGSGRRRMSVRKTSPHLDGVPQPHLQSNKIATRHLAKLAIVYVRQSSASRCERTPNQRGCNTISWTEPGPMAGLAIASRSWTMILESAGKAWRAAKDFNDCWRKSRWGTWEPCSVLR